MEEETGLAGDNRQNSDSVRASTPRPVESPVARLSAWPRIRASATDSRFYLTA